MAVWLLLLVLVMLLQEKLFIKSEFFKSFNTQQAVVEYMYLFRQANIGG